eukprot:9577260-Alexandrium_andersonii.AAC.1
MSASLVGSEMCIRDRRPPSPEQEPFLLGGRGVLAEPRPDPQALKLGLSLIHILTLPTICSV